SGSGRSEAATLNDPLRLRNAPKRPNGSRAERQRRQSAALALYQTARLGARALRERFADRRVRSARHSILERPALTAETRQFLCLTDNYGVLLHDPTTGTCASIDAPEPAPIFAALTDRGWCLTGVLITHHHADHVQAVPELKSRFPGLKVQGPAKE